MNHEGDCPHTYRIQTYDSLVHCMLCELWWNVMGQVINLDIYNKNYKRKLKKKRRQYYAQLARSEDEQDEVFA